MSWALSLLLAGWAVLFYLTMIDEINDEVDDSLENYAEINVLNHRIEVLMIGVGTIKLKFCFKRN
jgi:hypothetical protein